MIGFLSIFYPRPEYETQYHPTPNATIIGLSVFPTRRCRDADQLSNSRDPAFRLFSTTLLVKTGPNENGVYPAPPSPKRNGDVEHVLPNR